MNATATPPRIVTQPKVGASPISTGKMLYEYKLRAPFFDSFMVVLGVIAGLFVAQLMTAFMLFAFFIPLFVKMAAEISSALVR